MIYKGRKTAFTNIALTKYWGKLDDVLNTPTTNSIGLTLNHFSTTTEVEFSTEFKKDVFYLDGEKKESTKVFKVLDFVRNKYNVDLFAQVKSTNNVPDSAGFASSASAFAALALAIDEALELKLDKSLISEIARIGSGSAARSVFSGFSLWKNKPPYLAESILDDVDFEIQIVDVLSDTSKKIISSTKGMHLAQSSPLYSDWVKQSEIDTKNMLEAIKNRDFELIGSIAEKNALSMHRLNQTAKEPFDYFTPETNKIIDLIQKTRSKGFLVFATIDAGPNVKIIADTDGVLEIQKELNGFELLIQKPGGKND